MGFFKDFFSRLEGFPASLIGAIIGLSVGIFVLVFGFFTFLLLIGLTLGGFIIGKMIDDDSPAISSLKNFFTGKKSNNDNDDEDLLL